MAQQRTKKNFNAMDRRGKKPRYRGNHNGPRAGRQLWQLISIMIAFNKLQIISTSFR